MDRFIAARKNDKPQNLKHLKSNMDRLIVFFIVKSLVSLCI